MDENMDYQAKYRDAFYEAVTIGDSYFRESPRGGGGGDKF
jgi:hypothetical protein